MRSANYGDDTRLLTAFCFALQKSQALPGSLRQCISAHSWPGKQPAAYSIVLSLKRQRASVSCQMPAGGVAGLCPHQFCKCVVGIVVIDRSRRDEFMLDKDRGRNRPLIQQVKADPNQVVPIALRKISN